MVRFISVVIEIIVYPANLKIPILIKAKKAIPAPVRIEAA
jgi:hypothetical protein